MTCAVYEISLLTAMALRARWHRYGANESIAHQGRAKNWKN
jgi:hypothetical protein